MGMECGMVTKGMDVSNSVAHHAAALVATPACLSHSQPSSLAAELKIFD